MNCRFICLENSGLNQRNRNIIKVMALFEKDESGEWYDFVDLIVDGSNP